MLRELNLQSDEINNNFRVRAVRQQSHTHTLRSVILHQSFLTLVGKVVVFRLSLSHLCLGFYATCIMQPFKAWCF